MYDLDWNSLGMLRQVRLSLGVFAVHITSCDEVTALFFGHADNGYSGHRQKFRGMSGLHFADLVFIGHGLLTRSLTLLGKGYAGCFQDLVDVVRDRVRVRSSNEQGDGHIASPLQDQRTGVSDVAKGLTGTADDHSLPGKRNLSVSYSTITSLSMLVTCPTV